jgi:hypothetical protein
MFSCFEFFVSFGSDVCIVSTAEGVFQSCVKSTIFQCSAGCLVINLMSLFWSLIAKYSFLPFLVLWGALGFANFL